MTLEDEYRIVIARADRQRRKIADLQNRFVYYDRNVRDVFDFRSVYQQRSERLRKFFLDEAPQLEKYYTHTGMWTQFPKLRTYKKMSKASPLRTLTQIAERTRRMWW